MTPKPSLIHPLAMLSPAATDKTNVGKAIEAAMSKKANGTANYKPPEKKVVEPVQKQQVTITVSAKEKRTRGKYESSDAMKQIVQEMHTAIADIKSQMPSTKFGHNIARLALILGVARSNIRKWFARDDLQQYRTKPARAFLAAYARINECAVVTEYSEELIRLEKALELARLVINSNAKKLGDVARESGVSRLSLRLWLKHDNLSEIATRMQPAMRKLMIKWHDAAVTEPTVAKVMDPEYVQPELPVVNAKPEFEKKPDVEPCTDINIDEGLFKIAFAFLMRAAVSGLVSHKMLCRQSGIAHDSLRAWVRGTPRKYDYLPVAKKHVTDWYLAYKDDKMFESLPKDSLEIPPSIPKPIVKTERELIMELPDTVKLLPCPRTMKNQSQTDILKQLDNQVILTVLLRDFKSGAIKTRKDFCKEEDINVQTLRKWIEEGVPFDGHNRTTTHLHCWFAKAHPEMVAKLKGMTINAFIDPSKVVIKAGDKVEGGAIVIPANNNQPNIDIVFNREPAGAPMIDEAHSSGQLDTENELRLQPSEPAAVTTKLVDKNGSQVLMGRLAQLAHELKTKDELKLEESNMGTEEGLSPAQIKEIVAMGDGNVSEPAVSASCISRNAPQTLGQLIADLLALESKVGSNVRVAMSSRPGMQQRMPISDMPKLIAVSRIGVVEAVADDEKIDRNMEYWVVIPIVKQ